MFVLLFLFLIKKGWQFFVLYLFLLYELAPYLILIYFSFYTLKVIFNIFKFFVFFFLNIFYLYFYFYFGFLVVLLFLLVDFFTAIFYFLVFLLEYFHSSYTLFFTLIFYLIFIKFLLWCSFRIIGSIMNLLSIHVFTRRHNIIRYIWDVVYEEIKVPFVSINWRYLTTFIRIRHYKATIVFLYAIYVPFVLKIIFLDFNPTC